MKHSQPDWLYKRKAQKSHDADVVMYGELLEATC